jgi:hypothetical protein
MTKQSKANVCVCVCVFCVREQMEFAGVTQYLWCMLEMDGMDYSYMKRVITLADTSVTYVACIRWDGACISR